MIELRFDGLPDSPNRAGSGQHWSKGYKAKQEWQELVGYTALQAKRKAGFVGLYSKAKLVFTISVGDNRRHDPDNLAWAVTKPALDGIKGIIIEDDSIDNIVLAYVFNRDKPAGFTIAIDPIRE